MTATMEAPEITTLTFDAEHIARGWLSVALAVSDDDARPALTGLHVEFFEHGVRLVATDSYMLPLYEGAWPTWRSLWSSFSAETTSEIHFAPELIVARVGRLGKLHSEGIIRWQFGGPVRPAMIEVTPSDPRVMGIVMPTRVYLPGYAPEGTEREEPTPTGSEGDTMVTISHGGQSVVTTPEEMQRVADALADRLGAPEGTPE